MRRRNERSSFRRRKAASRSPPGRPKRSKALPPFVKNASRIGIRNKYSRLSPIDETVDLWSNGQGTEVAAFGLVWTAFMTLVAALLYLVGRRSAASAV